MLLELAVGDAYGAAFEYAPLELIRAHNSASYYSKHPRHSLAPGCYTDDTQMSIAVAEAILSGERWSPRLLAHHFVEPFGATHARATPATSTSCCAISRAATNCSRASTPTATRAGRRCGRRRWACFQPPAR
jgi:ADP-ribosylglycohydrolase